MNSWIFSVATLVAVLSFPALDAKGHSPRQYIDVVSCEVQKGKIVVVATDAVYELKRLRTDSKGPYVCPSDIISVHKNEAPATDGL